MHLIDKYLIQITTYRLVLYYLLALLCFGIIFGAVGIIPYSPVEIAITASLVVIFSYIFNWIFSKIFRATTNVESVFITAIILTLIMPVSFPQNIILLVLLPFLAMGSKYIVAYKKQHIFNPAATAVVVAGFISQDFAAMWWIGTPAFVVPVIVGGLLLTRRTQRFGLLSAFLAFYLLISSIVIFVSGGNITLIFSGVTNNLFHSALLFFAFVMLCEPITSPTTQRLQMPYAGIVGFLYAFPLARFIPLAITPELALLVGNAFSFFVSPKYRLLLKLERKEKITPDSYLFTFSHVDKFTFTPGQYMEWTLPHKKADSRGNRRYFSIASAPTEQNLMLLVKFYTPSSSYKKAMLGMQAGQEIVASNLSGDFVLPKNSTTPLVFLAGGIGISPFRSMIQYIIDQKLSVNIVLIFANKRREDILFEPLFKEAKAYGVKTIYVVTETDGHMTPDMVKRNIPDYSTRAFYISGPQLMVQSFEKVLKDAGVSRRKIKTDFFPGYTDSK